MMTMTMMIVVKLTYLDLASCNGVLGVLHGSDLQGILGVKPSAKLFLPVLLGVFFGVMLPASMSVATVDDFLLLVVCIGVFCTGVFLLDVVLAV